MVARSHRTNNDFARELGKMTMDHSTRNRNFFALCAMLSNSNLPRGNSRAHAAAEGFVDAEIVPVLRAALKNHTQLSAEEILKLVRPALIDAVVPIMKC